MLSLLLNKPLYFNMFSYSLMILETYHNTKTEKKFMKKQT